MTPTPETITTGLYTEGRSMPRIEYRVMIGNENVTRYMQGEWSEHLLNFLRNFDFRECSDCRTELIKEDDGNNPKCNKCLYGES